MKLKRLLSWLLTLAVLLGALPLSAAAAVDDNNGIWKPTSDSVWQIEYEVADGEATVTDVCRVEYEYEFPEDAAYDLVIPDTLGGAPVTKLGDASCHIPLRSVTIPASVTEIGWGVFVSQTKLTKVTFAPGSAPAFVGRSATHEGTFNGCTALESITLPAGTKNLVEGMFRGCTSLKSVNLQELTQLTEIPGLAFENTALTSVTLPATITAVRTRAFFGCKDGNGSPTLKSITLNEGLKSIGDDAFYYAGITTLKLPNSLTELEPGAFEGCESLTSITWPNNPDFTTVTGFGYCTALPDSILTTLPASVTALGDYAFEACAFTTIALPATLESIGQMAFFNCAQVTSITLPEQLKTIGVSAFEYCGKVSAITVPASATAIEKGAFALGSEFLELTVLGPDVELVFSEDYQRYEDGPFRGWNINQPRAEVHGYQYKSDGVTESDFYQYIQALQEEYPETWETSYRFVPLAAAQTYTVSGTVSPADAVITVKAGDSVLSPAITRAGESFSFTVANDRAVTVSFSKDGYFSRSFTRAAGSTGAWALGAVALQEMPENRRLTLTIQDGAGQLYSSLEGLRLTLKKGNTTLTPEKDYTVQFPYLVLGEDVDVAQSDTLTVTVTPEESLRCSAGSASASLADPALAVTLPVWGHGEITVSSGFTGGQNVLIYDGSGDLAEFGTVDTPEAGTRYTYTTGRLKAGSYTVVAFNVNGFVSLFQSLAALGDSGLGETTDYKKTTFRVADGQTAKATLTNIPTLDTQRFGSIVDTDYSCIRLDEDEPLTGVKFRARVYYGFREETVTGGTVKLTVPADAQVGSVYSEAGKLTSGADYTVDSAAHVVTLPVSRNRGVFLVDLTVAGTGSRYLSATLTAGGSASPLGSCAFDVYGARLHLPGDSFETKTAKITIGVRSDPNGGSVPVSVGLEGAAPALTLTAVPNKLGESSVSFTPGETAGLKDIKGGEKIAVTAGGNTGLMTYYPTGTSVREFFFTQYRSRYYIVKEGELQPSVYYNYMYEDPNNEEYQVWSFSATLRTGYEIDEGSVFVIVTMKDGSTRNVPLSLSRTTKPGVDEREYVFGGTMRLQQPDPHTFLNSRVPVKMELSYDTDFGESLTTDRPECTSAAELIAALKAHEEDEGDLEEWDEASLEEYRQSLENAFTTLYYVIEYNGAVTPENATQAQKDHIREIVDSIVTECVRYLTAPTPEMEEELDSAIFGTDWELGHEGLPDWDVLPPEDQQTVLDLEGSLLDLKTIAQDIGDKIGAALLSSFNAMDDAGKGKNGNDVGKDMGANVPEEIQDKIKKGTLDVSEIKVETDETSDHYTFRGPMGDILMELDNSILFGKVTHNADLINGKAVDRARPGGTDQTASGFDISGLSQDALTALMEWGSGWWLGHVGTFIDAVALPQVRELQQVLQVDVKLSGMVSEELVQAIKAGGTVTAEEANRVAVWMRGLNQKVAAAQHTAKKLTTTVKALKAAAVGSAVLTAGNTTTGLMNVYDQVGYWAGEKDRYDSLAAFWKNKQLADCEKFPTRASCVEACTRAARFAQELKNLHMKYIKFYAADVGFAGLALCPFSWPAGALMAGGGYLYSKCSDDAKAQIQADITEAELNFKKAEKDVRRYCKIDIDDCPPPPGGSGNGGSGSGSSIGFGDGSGSGVTVILRPGLDPSGVVYEAVLSNPLPGVKATLLYSENAAGTPSAVWDAENYGDQIDPQITGEDGAFAWYVPDGFYQVQLEKSGYTTQTTDWLEVPPPRLGVNVGLVSTADPTVESVRAYPDYIEVTYSQYMSTAEADTPGAAGYTAAWADPETAPDGTTQYAKVLRLTPADGGTVGSVGETVASVTVNGARNYAGNPAGGLDYTSGSLTVTHRADRLVLNYGGAVSVHLGESPIPRITVQVLDENGDPLMDRTVTASTVEGQQVARVEQVTGSIPGMTTFEAEGLFPGVTRVTFAVEGSALQETLPLVVTNEADRPARPTASAGGKTYTDTASITVAKGQTLTLSCATEGAVLYYTTDGTCPCQNTASRQVYTGPIPLTENTYFRIAAYQEGKDYSERLNLNVTVGADRRFMDVKEKDWFYDAVYYCVGKGYFNGMDDTHFGPGGTMTRAMFATVLHRMAGEPAVTGANPFTDVADGKWFTKGILWAAQQGIVTGYGGGKFGPDDPVTREQMVTIFWRYQGEPAGDAAALAGFTDAGKINSWAKDAFAWAVANGVISGKGNGILDPKGTARRSEVAQIVLNYDTKVR